jgi:hypothetical protein
LVTYGGGNGSQEAVDGETAQSVLEDGGGSLWCSSSSGGGLMVQAQAARVWMAMTPGKAPIYRGKGPA